MCFRLGRRRHDGHHDGHGRPDGGSSRPIWCESDFDVAGASLFLKSCIPGRTGITGHCCSNEQSRLRLFSGRELLLHAGLGV